MFPKKVQNLIQDLRKGKDIVKDKSLLDKIEEQMNKLQKEDEKVNAKEERN